MICCAAAGSDYRTREKKDVRVLVVGSTGYIGKFVTKELISRGFNVVAFAREQSGVGGKAKREDTEKVPLTTHLREWWSAAVNWLVPLVMR